MPNNFTIKWQFVLGHTTYNSLKTPLDIIINLCIISLKTHLVKFQCLNLKTVITFEKANLYML